MAMVFPPEDPVSGELWDGLASILLFGGYTKFPSEPCRAALARLIAGGGSSRALAVGCMLQIRGTQHNYARSELERLVEVQTSREDDSA
eukprot:2359904-Rhodomonas_salina.3